MKYFIPLVMGMAAPFAAAHTLMSTVYINDVSQGDGTCVRMNTVADNCTYPVPSLSSDDMACGATGETAVAYTCPAPAGAKISFEWRLWADGSNPGSIDPSHKGPCAVYAKQVANMSSTPAVGAGWFKIWEEGYDDSTSKWCTEKLVDADGMMSVQIPDGLPSGNYLFRPELLALHNAVAGDPQFYTGCAQVQVQGTSEGTLQVPSEYSVSIPGYVKDGEPSVSFNIYSPVFPYPMPGPSVYSVPSLSSTAATSNATIGGATLVPDNCLIKEANWCGVEVADYSDETSCWAASEACYAQGQTCYDTAPPSGYKNCDVWDTKCKGIQDACSAGSFTGPPNKGEKLADSELGTPVVVPEIDNLGGGTSNSNSTSTNAINGTASPAPASTATSTATLTATSTVASSTEYVTESPATSDAASSTDYVAEITDSFSMAPTDAAEEYATESAGASATYDTTESLMTSAPARASATWSSASYSGMASSSRWRKSKGFNTKTTPAKARATSGRETTAGDAVPTSACEKKARKRRHASLRK
ncbi:hypothetical protein SUNI508_04718 [Seiridium unicorne]|uniref:lytic cellulose monooxygenase (C4-dehydrogenating) n=1 Tax=Seiridium unicorne TaxID=138068 RepID=A0ABR2V626_9PEZI